MQFWAFQIPQMQKKWVWKKQNSKNGLPSKKYRHWFLPFECLNLHLIMCHNGGPGTGWNASTFSFFI